MTIDFVYKKMYTKLLTCSFNLARDLIGRMMTFEWLLKVPPYLRSRYCEWFCPVEKMSYKNVVSSAP